MSKTELKPCPFCEGEAKLLYYKEHNLYRIQCVNPKCLCGVMTIFFNDEKEAINAWNTRPTVKQYKYNYDEDEIKKLAEEKNVSLAKARNMIYQRIYNKEYRKKNKEHLAEYRKKWGRENNERIKMMCRERYRRKKEESYGNT